MSSLSELKSLHRLEQKSLGGADFLAKAVNLDSGKKERRGQGHASSLWGNGRRNGRITGFSSSQHQPVRPPRLQVRCDSARPASGAGSADRRTETRAIRGGRRASVLRRLGRAVLTSATQPADFAF